MSPFIEKLQLQWSHGRFECVGIDPDTEAMKLPLEVRKDVNQLYDAVRKLCIEVIDASFVVAAAYKINAGFFEEFEFGGSALLYIIRYIRRKAPHAVIILDGKRGDIGNTSKAYARGEFDHLDVDAITVNPYLGRVASLPFLERKDRGIIVLCRTSNEDAGEFQDVIVTPPEKYAAKWGIPMEPMPFYLYVAYRVARAWNEHGNCALVVGATAPTELKRIRQAAGTLPILLPGFGTQRGSPEEALPAGLTPNGDGILCNVSSAIMFASDKQRAAFAWHDRFLTVVKRFESGEAA